MSCPFATKSFRQREAMDIISAFLDVQSLGAFMLTERTFSRLSAKHGPHLHQCLVENAIAQRSDMMMQRRNPRCPESNRPFSYVIV